MPPLAEPDRDRSVLRESIESIRKQVRDYLQDLICADRHIISPKNVPGILFDLLGNSRPSISVASGMLKEQGIIEYTRGVIHIPDLERLEAKACECYHIIKDHLDNHMEFDRGIPVRRSLYREPFA